MTKGPQDKQAAPATPRKKLHLFQHGTGVRLATINPKDLNAWCDAYGYLPHSKISKVGYRVIAK